MRKPTICIGENKGADQLRSDCDADQGLCFRHSDSTIPLLLKSEISIFYLFSVLVQVGLCQTCSETTLLVFPRGGSNVTVGFLIIGFYAAIVRQQCLSHVKTTTVLARTVRSECFLLEDTTWRRWGMNSGMKLYQ